jgi:two-component system phosphate regulon response regulator PhoB
MIKENILIVDDEEDILELVKHTLEKDGYQITCVNSGEAALKIAEELKPDLIVLDLMLPGLDGLDVCRRLKNNQRTKKIRIIMLSARGEEADIVAGLELGAEDFVVKPFNARVLRARIKAAIRRNPGSTGTTTEIVTYGPFAIDISRHIVYINKKELELTASEFKLLHHLVANPGRVFTRSQIVLAVHGENYPVTDRSVDVQVVSLRKKLGEVGEMVETVRGVGYRMSEL